MSIWLPLKKTWKPYPVRVPESEKFVPKASFTAVLKELMQGLNPGMRIAAPALQGLHEACEDPLAGLFEDPSNKTRKMLKRGLFRKTVWFFHRLRIMFFRNCFPNNVGGKHL